MARLNVAVIGAGPAGLTAAFALARGGADVDVFEASGNVGGIARSVSLWGHRIDVGPHIVSGGSAGAIALWEQLVGPDYQELPVRRAVLTQGRIIEYPPTAMELLRKLPAVTFARCAAGLTIARAREWLGPGQRAGSAEAWVVQCFGRALYQTLFQQYIEKLWGRPGTSIDDNFTRTLFGAVRAMGGMQGATPARCRHPKGGTGAVWDRMAAAIREAGGSIRCNSPVRRIVTDHARVVGLELGCELESFDHVHSTMPLRHLVQAIDAPPKIREAIAGLEARHVLLAHLLVQGGKPLAHLWVQVYDSRFRVGRVTDSGAWSGSPEGEPRVVTMEYWCSEEDATWRLTDDEVLSMAAGEWTACSLAPGAVVRAGHVTRLPAALPVPSRGYTRGLDLVRAHCTGISGLTIAGRHGSHAINSIIDNVDDGLRSAAQIFALAGGAPVRRFP